MSYRAYQTRPIVVAIFVQCFHHRNEVLLRKKVRSGSRCWWRCRVELTWVDHFVEHLHIRIVSSTMSFPSRDLYSQIIWRYRGLFGYNWMHGWIVSWSAVDYNVLFLLTDLVGKFVMQATHRRINSVNHMIGCSSLKKVWYSLFLLVRSALVMNRNVVTAAALLLLEVCLLLWRCNNDKYNKRSLVMRNNHDLCNDVLRSIQILVWKGMI